MPHSADTRVIGIGSRGDALPVEFVADQTVPADGRSVLEANAPVIR